MVQMTGEELVVALREDITRALIAASKLDVRLDGSQVLLEPRKAQALAAARLSYTECIDRMARLLHDLQLPVR